MTRINVAVQPSELTSKHIVAEHREMVRVPNLIKKGKFNLKNVPPQFKLEKGHVAFFYNKLGYLHKRYKLVHAECLRRGFKVTDFNSAFENLPSHLYNDYTETSRDRGILLERLRERNLKSYEHLN